MHMTGEYDYEQLGLLIESLAYDNNVKTVLPRVFNDNELEVYVEDHNGNAWVYRFNHDSYRWDETRVA